MQDRQVRYAVSSIGNHHRQITEHRPSIVPRLSVTQARDRISASPTIPCLRTSQTSNENHRLNSADRPPRTPSAPDDLKPETRNRKPAN